MARAPQRRGGNHHIYGVFIGGAPLDDNYRLTGERHYHFTAQRRGAKVINSIKQTLLNAINSKDTDKFNGNIKKTKSSVSNKLIRKHLSNNYKKA